MSGCCYLLRAEIKIVHRARIELATSNPSEVLEASHPIAIAFIIELIITTSLSFASNVPMIHAIASLFWRDDVISTA